MCSIIWLIKGKRSIKKEQGRKVVIVALRSEKNRLEPSILRKKGITRMEHTIEKLHKLHASVQKLEAVLQEVWSLVDEIHEDDQFTDLLNRAKKYQTKKQKTDQSIEELIVRLDEFEQGMEEIPEDGTAAVDFEDAIADLIEWMRNNQ